MDFRKLNDQEVKDLLQALRGNAEQDGTILIDSRDTSFAGYARGDIGEDDGTAETINAIKSVPTHY